MALKSKEQTVARIEVLADSWTDVTRERDSYDEWSADDTDTSWDINGIKVLDGKEGYADLDIDFEPKPGDSYYLVLVTYHSGDSFSNHDNACVEYIDLYRDLDSAERIRNEILRHDESNSRWSDDKPFKLVLTLDNGKEIEYPAPWHGYFNGLGDVRVVMVRL